jgi:hypothetical protein
MRKRMILERQVPAREGEWLDLEALASVELSSEAPDHPIEAALLPGGGGWRAAEPGEQRIRLCFDAPQRLRRIFLLFLEPARERTQEFVLLWSRDGQAFQELVRQQWNFNPRTAARQLEDYRVALEGVAALELRIRPDLQGGDAVASLEELRLG